MISFKDYGKADGKWWEERLIDYVYYFDPSVFNFLSNYNFSKNEVQRFEACVHFLLIIFAAKRGI